jgi:hypothetical protein
VLESYAAFERVMCGLTMISGAGSLPASNFSVAARLPYEELKR